VPAEEEVADRGEVGVRAAAPLRESTPVPRQRRRDDDDDDDDDERAPAARRRRRDYDDDDDDDDYELRRPRSLNLAGGSGLQLGLGIAALAVGIIGLLISWIPVVGALLCGIGLVLGLPGVIVAVVRRRGYGFPIAGSAVSGVALVISLILTFVILAAVQNAAQIAMQMQPNAAPVGPPTPPAGAIALVGGQGQVAGQLTPADPVDRVHFQSRCKVFTVVMRAGRTYQIDMLKNPGINPIDPFLRLEDSAGNQLMMDDDGGGNLDARIVFICPQNGTFRVVATSLFGETGGFTLRVVER
jgi:hypothetical protein